MGAVLEGGPHGWKMAGRLSRRGVVFSCVISASLRDRQGLLWRAEAHRQMTVEVNGAQVSQEQWGARWATLYVAGGFPPLCGHSSFPGSSLVCEGQAVLNCICGTSRAGYLFSLSQTSQIAIGHS